MSARRKIAVFTGNRAEYGLQVPILRAIAAHPDLEYFLLVSGAHLDADFGRTRAEITADGFRIHREIRLEYAKDDLHGTAVAIASGIRGLAEVHRELRPDLSVVYADRFEGFAAVIASTQMGIPTAHIEGGDVTQGGALDDSVRHAMTKLSHLHFTTNAEASARVLAMGEEDWRVHTVGFPAIDLIAAGSFAPPEEIRARFGIDPDRPVVVFTQHSVATLHDEAEAQFRPSLEALEILAREGVQVVATYPNNDAGGRRIIAALEAWAERKIPNVQVHKNLGRLAFHGFLNLCGRVAIGACAGNSSSGIKETPALGCPAVNIGSRQEGRLRSTNVIDAPYDRDAILAALRRCLFDRAFRAACASCENPYGIGNAGPTVARILAEVPLDRKLLIKRMTI